MTPCPDPRELLQLLDGELTENRADALRVHLTACPRCAAESAAQHRLVDRIAAPIPALPAPGAVEAVMGRLGAAPEPGPARFLPPRWSLAAGGLAAAAALVLAVQLGNPPRPDRGEFVARGAPVEWSRKIGVELWALEGAPRRIEPGGSMGRSTAVVASYTNVDVSAAWLLAFAVDAHGDVRWLYPAFTDPSTDPEAVRLEPSGRQQPFAEAVAFEDLPAGPLRFVTLVTRSPLHVRDVERLRREELGIDALRARWPEARIEELPFTVSPAAGQGRTSP